MSTGQYLLLFFAVILGGGIGLYLQRQNRTNLKVVLAFSGAFLLGITVLHLMPSVYEQQKEQAGLWILLGFFIQLALEQLSTGVEHGHVHVHSHAPRGFAIQVMIGLSLHAFLEGMPLSGYEDIHGADQHDHTHNHLLYGVVLHKAPAAFALVVLLLSSQIKKSVVIACLVFFAAMSPAGALLTQVARVNQATFGILLAIVIGSFLHIATTILFESGERGHHGVSRRKLIAIVFGVGMALLTMLG
jgi:zinc transporter ZupT